MTFEPSCTLQCTATHCTTLQHTATPTQCDRFFCHDLRAFLHTATHCNALQHTAMHCTALHRTATHCNALQCTTPHCNILQHTTTHCSMLQHTATYCNILQHTATYCNTVSFVPTYQPSRLEALLTLCMACKALQHTATHCNTLQHTVTHCNTLHHIATHCNTLQHTATHCLTFYPFRPQPLFTHCNALNALKRTATRYDMLQHIVSPISLPAQSLFFLPNMLVSHICFESVPNPEKHTPRQLSACRNPFCGL